MFSKPEMVRKELYCTKSIISKFAVHRHFNSIFSHKGNIMQNIQFASTKHWFGKTYSCQIKAGSELKSAWKWIYGLPGNRMRITQMLASCCQGVHGTTGRFYLRRTWRKIYPILKGKKSSLAKAKRSDLWSF